ncbi:MAG: hypothetical protein K9K32_07250, partial [Halanaerobiales bacterium]|nr:hypothetical protein [Halanaerobiales bacterium]
EKERQEEVVFEVIKTMNSGWTPNWNVLEQEEKLLSEKQYKQIQELRNILGERQLFAGAGKFIDAEELPVEEGEKYTLTEIIQLAKEHSNKWQKVKKTEKEEEEHYHKCLEDAKRIGEKVELNRYTTHCNDPQKECSTDIVTVYITPEGKEVSERIHTH